MKSGSYPPPIPKELAALKGHLGDTVTEAREQLKFRAQTLQTEADARMFEREFRNLGAASVGTGPNAIITPEEANKLMVKSGAFQAVEGGDAMAHGRAAALIPALMGGKNVTADAAYAQEVKMFNMMQKGGFTLSSGMNQLVDTQAYTRSDVFKDLNRNGDSFKGIDRQVALLSAMATAFAPDKAGTRVENLVSATTGSYALLRHGHTDEGTINRSAYLKSVGADEKTDDAQDMAEKISKDLAKNRAGLPGGVNAYSYLQRHGYINRDEIQALMGFHGMYQGGAAGNQWAGFVARASTKTGLLPEEENAPGFVSVDQRMRDYQSSAAATRARAELSKQQGELTRGSGAISHYQPLQQQAYQLLASKDRSWATPGGLADWKDSWIQGGNTAINRELMDATMEVARKGGLPASHIMSGVNAKTGQRYDTGGYDFGAAGRLSGDIFSIGTSEETRQKAIIDVIARVQQMSGGNVSDTMKNKQDAPLGRAIDVLGVIEQNTRPKQQAPPPLPGGIKQWNPRGGP